MQSKIEKADITISTVIPTYKRPELLKRAILSVLNQSYPHLKVCVYDNASGDDTESVVNELMEKDNRVNYYKHDKNIGSYKNFNFGLSRVGTQYFSLLSDDDILEPDFYKNALAGFEKYPDAMFSCMDSIVIDEYLQVISGPVGPEDHLYFNRGDGLKPLINVEIPNTWTGMVFNKKVIDEIGVIDEEAGPFADGGFVYHAASRFPFVVCPGIGAILMRHDDSTSGMVKFVDDDWFFWKEKMRQRIREDNKVPSSIRSNIDAIINPDIKKVAMMHAGKSLLAFDLGRAGLIASTLRRQGDIFYSLLISLSAGVIKLFPFIVKIYALYYSLRKRKINERCDKLNKKYYKNVEFIGRLK